jgi:UDP-N-acetylglucosamine 4-epimerase
MMGKVNILVTGGAGFIGSNLVKHFLNDNRIGIVRVLDDLSTGRLENLGEFERDARFEFVKGDISNYEVCKVACKGIHRISHQAALGSVPRSIENPMRSTEVNVLGTVNLLHAAVQSGIDRIVLACSSSSYGDHPGLPKEEETIGNPLSPYAVTKLSIEHFARVFGDSYGIHWIGLRYFNVFGPNQNPNGAYAAVIPLFCRAILEDAMITINGDGKTSRDFTHIDNIVNLNELALFTENVDALNQVYNGACGGQTSLNEVVSCLERLSGKLAKISHGPERIGDVRHSNASIAKASRLLGYHPEIGFEEGLEKALDWYSKNY